MLGSSAGAAESSRRPQFVQEPVLGLRLPAASLKLDPVPDDIRALCDQMADNENWTGRQWIFGMAKNATASYYVANGYYQRRHPKHGERLYYQPDDGGVYQVSDGTCKGDPARETFAVRDARQIPREILQELATDLATRLSRAAGGPDRLRAAIRKQRIDFEKLSPEMQEAFKPYFTPAK